jgi:hypothetical protein
MKARALSWFLWFGILWMYGITILRGLGRPIDWAEGHWLIGYQFGFLKRALPGALLGFFLTHENAERLITVVSTVILGLFFLALGWLGYRIIKKSASVPAAVLVILTFLTSPYIVMSAFLNGYYDNILVLITMAAVLLMRHTKYWLAATLLAVGILVHENIFVVGFPSVLFAAVLYDVTDEGAFNWRTFLRKSIPLLLPVLVFVCLFFYQSRLLNGDLLRNQLSSYLAQFDFIQHRRNIRVPDAFTISFLDYTERQSQYFLSRIFNKNFLVRNLPSLIALLLYASDAIRNLVARKPLIAVLITSALIPLSLHLIARDTSRIWTFPLVAAYIGLWIIFEIGPAILQPIKSGMAYNLFFTAVIINNIFIQTPLMDSMTERYSNFMRFWLYIPAFVLVLCVSTLMQKYSRRETANELNP